jgi:hypothetical protein
VKLQRGIFSFIEWFINTKYLLSAPSTRRRSSSQGVECVDRTSFYATKVPVKKIVDGELASSSSIINSNQYNDIYHTHNWKWCIDDESEVRQVLLSNFQLRNWIKTIPQNGDWNFYWYFLAHHPNVYILFRAFKRETVEKLFAQGNSLKRSQYVGVLVESVDEIF